MAEVATAVSLLEHDIPQGRSEVSLRDSLVTRVADLVKCTQSLKTVLECAQSCERSVRGHDATFVE